MEIWCGGAALPPWYFHFFFPSKLLIPNISSKILKLASKDREFCGILEISVEPFIKKTFGICWLL
jgi:hypothetical protein